LLHITCVIKVLLQLNLVKTHTANTARNRRNIMTANGGKTNDRDNSRAISSANQYIHV